MERHWEHDSMTKMKIQPLGGREGGCTQAKNVVVHKPKMLMAFPLKFYFKNKITKY
jgi:hypothetical protein